MNNRSDFSAKVKRSLAERSGFVCSFPGCNKSTIGPLDEIGITNTGNAAHIIAAANGPRSDPSMLDDDRSSIDNGIWLCSNHHKIIDDGRDKYTPTILKEWRLNSEERAQNRLESGIEQRDRYDLVKSYLQVMVLQKDIENTLTDWPRQIDLVDVDGCEVFIDKTAIDTIELILSNANNRRILLEGSGGRGKTALSRVYSYVKNREEWSVYFIDMREIGVEKISLLSSDMKWFLEGKKSPVLFILENAHNSEEVTDKIIRLVDDLFVNFPNSHYMFTSRDTSRDKELDPFIRWKNNGLVYSVCPKDKNILKILSTFLQAHSIAYEISELDTNWISDNIYSTFNRVDTNVGGDLRLLRLYLLSWNYTEKRLYDLTEQDIIVRLKRHIIIEELSRNVALISLLGKLCAIFQFDVPFYGTRQSYSDSRAYINDLDSLRRKGLIKYIGKDFYALAHSLDAYYISMALAQYSGEEPEEYASKRIAEYITELPKTPSSLIVDNLTNLFKSLYFDNPSEYEKHVFINTLNANRQYLIDTITKLPSSISIIERILEAVEVHLGIQAAYEFWCEISHKLKDLNMWSEILVENKPFYIALLIKAINRVSPDETNAFSAITEMTQEFRSIFLKSDLNRLKELLNVLPDPIIENLTEKMDIELLARKIIESKKVHLSFMLRKLPLPYSKKLFDYIGKNKWDDFVQFFKKEKDKQYPKILLDQIRNVDSEFEHRLRLQLKSYLEDLRNQNRKRSSDGRLLINNKIANNYCNAQLNKVDFCKYLEDNFEPNFMFTVDSSVVMARLITKIYESSYRTDKREYASTIVKSMVNQLPINVISDLCYDYKTLDKIKKLSEGAYNYVVSVTVGEFTD